MARPEPVFNFCRPFINKYRKFPFLGMSNFDKAMNNIEKTYADPGVMKAQYVQTYKMTMYRRAPRNLTAIFTYCTLALLFLDMILVFGAYFSVGGVPGSAVRNSQL